MCVCVCIVSTYTGFARVFMHTHAYIRFARVCVFSCAHSLRSCMSLLLRVVMVLGASLVQNFLVQSFSAYFDNVDKDNVSASVLRGDLALTNLHFRKSVLDHLGVRSVSLVHGTVGSLHVRVPWHKFGTAPIVLELDNLFVLLESRTDGFAATNDSEIAELEKVKLAAVELVSGVGEVGVADAGAGDAPSGASGWKSWLYSAGRVAKRLIDYLEIRIQIKNVHIRYTSDRFSAGATLDALSIITNTQANSRKVLDLVGFGVYLNPEKSELQDAFEEFPDDLGGEGRSPVASAYQYVLDPVSGGFSVCVFGSGEMVLEGKFACAVITLTRDQLGSEIFAELEKILVVSARKAAPQAALVVADVGDVGVVFRATFELESATLKTHLPDGSCIDFAATSVQLVAHGGSGVSTHLCIDRLQIDRHTREKTTNILSTGGGEFVKISIEKRDSLVHVGFNLGPVVLKFYPKVIGSILSFVKSFPKADEGGSEVSTPVRIEFCWESMSIDWFQSDQLFAKSEMTKSRITLELWDKYFISRGELGDFSITHAPENASPSPILSLANPQDSYLFKFLVRSYDELDPQFPGYASLVEFDLNAVQLVIVRSVLLRFWSYIFDAFIPAIVGELTLSDSAHTATTPENSPPIAVAKSYYLLNLRIEALELVVPVSATSVEEFPFTVVLRRLVAKNQGALSEIDVIDFDLEKVEMKCLNESVLVGDDDFRVTASLFREQTMRVAVRLDHSSLNVPLTRGQFCYLCDLLNFNILGGASDGVLDTEIVQQPHSSAIECVVSTHDVQPWLLLDFKFGASRIDLSEFGVFSFSPVGLLIRKFEAKTQICVSAESLGLNQDATGPFSFELDSDDSHRSIFVKVDNPQLSIEVGNLMNLWSYFFDEFDEYSTPENVILLPMEAAPDRSTNLNVNLTNPHLRLPIDTDAFVFGAEMLSFNQSWADGVLHKKIVGTACSIHRVAHGGHPSVDNQIGARIHLFVSGSWDTHEERIKCSCEPIELRLQFSHIKAFSRAIERQALQMLPPTQPAVTAVAKLAVREADIILHALTLLIVNDFGPLQNTPLLLIKVTNFQAASSASVSRSGFTISGDLAISVFNKSSVEWEPFIENVCAETSHSSAVKLHVRNSVTELADGSSASQLVFDVQNGGIQLNVTEALIEAAVSNWRLWTAGGSAGGGWKSVFAPYSVRNMTGGPVSVLGNLVENRADLPLMGVTVDETASEHRRVVANVSSGGWSIPRIPLDKRGSYLYSIGLGVGDLIATVRVDGGRKVLTLESSVMVSNQFGGPIWLKVGADYEVLIHPGGSAPVPLFEVLIGSATGGGRGGIFRIKPADDDSVGWSGSVSIADIRSRSESKLWQVNAGDKYMYISGKSAEIVFQDRVCSQLTISVFAPVRLRSTIPAMVDFQVSATGGSSAGSISLNGQEHIVTVPLTGRLEIRFTMFGSSWSVDAVQIWPTIPEQLRQEESTKQYYLPIKLVDESKNFFHFRLYYDQIGGKPPELTLHTSHWLVCIDVPSQLRFAYDLGDEWSDAWGGIQWAKTSTDNKKTYTVPLDTKAKRIGAYLNSKHSEYVVVDTVGASGSMTVEATSENGVRLKQDLAVRVTSAPAGAVRDFPVKITTVSPRYVVVNTLPATTLYVRQQQAATSVRVKPNEQIPYKWWAPGNGRMLQVAKQRRSDVHESHRRSSVVQFDVTGDNRRSSVVQGDVPGRRSSVGQFDVPGDNRRSSVVQEDEHRVNKRSSVAQEPNRRGSVVQETNRRGSVEHGGVQGDNRRSSVVQQDTNRRSSVVRKGMHGDNRRGSVMQGDGHGDKHDLHWSEEINVDEIGESLVRGADQLRVEVRIYHGVFYIVFSSTVDTADFLLPSPSLLSNSVYRLVLPSLCVSLTGSDSEMLLLDIQTLILNLSLSPVLNEIDLRTASIQLDDYRPDAKFPVVISRAISASPNKRAPAPLAIECTASWVPPKPGDTTLSFETCALKFGDLDIAIDYTMIAELTELVLRAVAQPDSGFTYKFVPIAEILPVGSLRIWNFSQFLLQGMRVNLSFSPGSGGVGVNFSVLHRAIASMSAVERSPLKIHSLVLSNFRASRSNMVSIVGEHYKHELYREMRTIMGSAEAFGNPIGLIGSVSTGVSDLFYEPFAAIRDMQKPQDVMNVADKTAKGAKSFFKNTAFGVFNSMSKLAATSAQTLSILTEDDEYLNERKDFNSKNKPSHVGDGMVVGAASFGRGLISGLSGLVTKPVEGMEQDGLAGFAKGTMKGVGGFFLKPVAGLLDFAKSTADGVVVSTKDSRLDVAAIRLPRMLYGHDRTIRVINPEHSLLRWYLIQLDGMPANFTYSGHIYDAQNGTIVAATATYLVAADTHARRISLLVPIWRVLGVAGDLDRLVLSISVLTQKGSTSQLDLELSSVFMLKSVQQLIASAMEI